MRMWRNWQTRRFQVPVGDRAGSNPVIRTNDKMHLLWGASCRWYEPPKLWRDLRVGAVLREQNALPYEVWITINLTAKEAIDNCRAGRAAKGANPFIRTSKLTNFDKKFVDFPYYTNCICQRKKSWQWSIDKEKMYAIIRSRLQAK